MILIVKKLGRISSVVGLWVACGFVADSVAQEPGGSSGLAGSLRPFVERHELAGAVMLVASGEKLLDLETVGYADVAAGKRMRADDLFWIASMSKAITAAGLMMLVDEGKVHLDDPVARYLPEFHGQWLAVERNARQLVLHHPAHPITVREILSHTSGLPFTSAMETPTLDMLPLWIATRSYAMTPLVFEPGTRYAYSNAGINTAGRIIEVASGQRYAEFMQRRLFDPLGMVNTTFWPTPSQLDRLAKSYKPGAKDVGLEEIRITQLKYPLSDHSRQPMPAGGLFSTARDVGRFCQMLLQGGTYRGKRYLSEKAVNEMTHRQTAKNIPESYGFGLAVDREGFSHGGAYSTQMWVDKRRGLVLVLMVQHAGFPNGAGGRINDAFQQAAFRKYAK